VLKVSDFMGARVASFRQYFRSQAEDGSTLLPMAKGISMRDEAMKLLCESVANISEALEARNQMYFLRLTETKTVMIKEYRGKWGVDIREVAKSRL